MRGPLPQSCGVVATTFVVRKNDTSENANVNQTHAAAFPTLHACSLQRAGSSARHSANATGKLLLAASVFWEECKGSGRTCSMYSTCDGSISCTSFATCVKAEREGLSALSHLGCTD